MTAFKAMTPPSKRLTLSIRLNSHDLADATQQLKDIAAELALRADADGPFWALSSSGYSVECVVHESVTRESYYAALARWIDEDQAARAAKAVPPDSVPG